MIVDLAPAKVDLTTLLNRQRTRKFLLCLFLCGSLSPALRQKQTLLQRRHTGGAGAYGCGAESNHGIGERTKVANTGLVRSRWRSNELVGGNGSSRSARQLEGIAALEARGQSLVDIARLRASRRCATGSAERAERACKSHRRVHGAIRNLRRIQGSQRSHGRGLVRRNPCVEQVRDRDGRDNQNDSYHNQQLDQRKPLLLLHFSGTAVAIWSSIWPLGPRHPPACI